MTYVRPFLELASDIKNLAALRSLLADDVCFCETARER
jgi:hypothetical protein